MEEGHLSYDWNTRERGQLSQLPKVQLHDETLRDGLQSPSATDPTLDQKKQIVDLLEEVGVSSACIGLPGASERSHAHTLALVRHCEIAGHRLALGAAARTHVADLEPIADISQRAGRPLEAMMFLGSSPMRMYAEHWELPLLVTRTRTAVRFAVEHGMKAGFVTEDTTRTPPATLEVLFRTAVDEGASRLVLCDTVGHATPDGVVNLVRWTQALLADWGVTDTVALDWHGHDDRGLALTNALYAASSGVQRVHGTVLGIGERVGNTPLDLLLVNLALLNGDTSTLAALARLTDLAADALGVAIPIGYPVFGRDAFRTATGVHAAAIVKAMAAGDLSVADLVYSSVPARQVGRSQRIDVGHMSGKSNIRHWLTLRGLEATDSQIDGILTAAKDCASTLSDDRMLALLEGP